MQGKVPFVSSNGINQLHIFIFVLACFHVVCCILTMALGRAKVIEEFQFSFTYTKYIYAMYTFKLLGWVNIYRWENGSDGKRKPRHLSTNFHMVSRLLCVCVNKYILITLNGIELCMVVACQIYIWNTFINYAPCIVCTSNRSWAVQICKGHLIWEKALEFLDPKSCSHLDCKSTSFLTVPKWCPISYHHQ